MTDSASMPTPFDTPRTLSERLTFPTARIAYRQGVEDGGGAPLLRVANQLGLEGAADAESALIVGARLLAHGFSDSEINDMIIHHYHQAARRESGQVALEAGDDWLG